RTAIAASLDQARRMGRYSLEVRCRVYLARIAIGERRFADALTTLGDVAADGDLAIGPELQAQVHYWRARALERHGDRDGAMREMDAARAMLERLRTLVPDRYRRSFDSRPDVQLVTAGST